VLLQDLKKILDVRARLSKSSTPLAKETLADFNKTFTDVTTDEDFVRRYSIYGPY
jgi:hypothetical protein